MTPEHFMLIDILSSRAITALTSLKKVPSMTSEEVKAETAKWEAMSEDEMERKRRHGQ